MNLESLFQERVEISGNLIKMDSQYLEAKNQKQTTGIFSDKWEKVDKSENNNIFFDFQYQWFFDLYGFKDENDISNYLKDKKIIVDTGCGLGYKAAWLAKLAPNSVVIGIDISDACLIAAKNYSDIPNLFFLKRDIADTKLVNNSVDFMICDQVIMHTENPDFTFKHLAMKTKREGEFACYFYRKKALPRELVDDYFRNNVHKYSNEQIWKFSEQLTELGKRLDALKIDFEVPEIELLGIEKGKMSIQRFVYWNFLKCFWRDDWGFDMSMSTNYDWYAPSNARRFSVEEVNDILSENKMKSTHFHQEEACFSGRFVHI